jgi:hypothetical protein
MNMKNLIVGLLLLAGSAVSASPIMSGAYMTSQQLKDYKTAVHINFAAGSFACSDGLNSLSTMEAAQEGTIELNGTQPLLQFKTVYTSQEIFVVSVRTSADFRSVQSIESVKYATEPINQGDLRNPIIQMGLVSKGIEQNCIVKR